MNTVDTTSIQEAILQLLYPDRLTSRAWLRVHLRKIGFISIPAIMPEQVDDDPLSRALGTLVHQGKVEVERAVTGTTSYKLKVQRL